tara:strand:+ start:365 stop:730 length:366 start_codon:yes stop_codon:yes gene_type:complete
MFDALKKYAVFEGRARRKEFWLFNLFCALGFLTGSFLDGMLGLYDLEAGMGLIGGLFVLAMVVPSISVTVRRLHDTGKSGWFYLLAFIPLANIVLFIFMFFNSSAGSNQYGDNPKEEIPSS